jgi:hypothetical protein
MAPAFTSLRQATGFLLLLAAFLLLPLLTARMGLFTRAAAYASMPESAGPFSYIHQQVFEEKSELDIAFIGSSAMLYGIDTPYVQKALSDRLGHPASVTTLGSYWPGQDRTYLVLRDLLQHRKVKMVVLNIMFEDFDEKFDAPYNWAYRFYPMDNDGAMFQGLQFHSQAALYADTSLGIPRHFLSLVRANLLEEPPLAKTCGSKKQRIGFNGSEATFIPFTPPALHLEPAALIYSPATAKNFHFSGKELTPFQKHFTQQVGRLARENGVHLVILDIPRNGHDRASKVEAFTDWTKVLTPSTDLVGVPTEQLFEGLKDEDGQKLFFDKAHLNANGSPFFTQTITPALLEIYAKNNL